ncbi:MAG: nicotinate phosphoribosyltransferase [Clostridia bacterium]|nr:nicotinate phosphoribosyltransferase [Clostridia bacterium]
MNFTLKEIDAIVRRVLECFEKCGFPIQYMLENDLYKFSMGQFVLHRYSKTRVRVEFRCRSKVKLGFLKPLILACVERLKQLRFQDGEIRYMRTSPFLKWLADDYIDYLRRFFFFAEQLTVDVDREGQLVMFAEGPWRDVIYFEVPCLAIVEECYMRFVLASKDPSEVAAMMKEREKRLAEKIEFLNRLYEKHPFTLSEFGLRRRTSGEWEETVVARMKEGCKAFVGTSNVHLARKYEVMPCGTMAHELYMGLQGEDVNMRNIQQVTWRQWREEFGRKNGIMLTDIFGARACFRAMNEDDANAFTGFRHDSGDPVVWGIELMARLKELGIDPATKTFVWSDCLNMELIGILAEKFSGKVRVSFGVGTDLVNCIPGISPVSEVMKMTYSNGQPVLKLSDDVGGKGMCPSQALVESTKELYRYDPIVMDRSKWDSLVA